MPPWLIHTWRVNFDATVAESSQQRGCSGLHSLTAGLSSRACWRWLSAAYCDQSSMPHGGERQSLRLASRLAAALGRVWQMTLGWGGARMPCSGHTWSSQRTPHLSLSLRWTLTGTHAGSPRCVLKWPDWRLSATPRSQRWRGLTDSTGVNGTALGEHTAAGTEPGCVGSERWMHGAQRPARLAIFCLKSESPAPFRWV